jgi:xanthosine utilization system XapX-like protein
MALLLGMIGIMMINQWIWRFLRQTQMMIACSGEASDRHLLTQKRPGEVSARCGMLRSGKHGKGKPHKWSFIYICRSSMVKW